MSDKEIIEQNKDAKFIGFIKVGNRGVPMVFTDKSKYQEKLDRVWDSGHDFECRVLRDE